MIKVIHNDNWLTFAQLSAKLDTEVKLRLRDEEFKIREQLMDKLRKICLEERRALERMKRESKLIRMGLEQIQKRTPSLLRNKAHIIRPLLPLEKDITDTSVKPEDLTDVGSITTSTSSPFELKDMKDAMENVEEDEESGFWTADTVSTDDYTLPSTASLPLCSSSLQYRYDSMGINNNPGRHTNRFAYVFTDDLSMEANHKPTYADQRSQIRMRKAGRLCDTIEQLKLRREQVMYPNLKKTTKKLSVSKTT